MKIWKIIKKNILERQNSSVSDINKKLSDENEQFKIEIAK